MNTLYKCENGTTILLSPIDVENGAVEKYDLIELTKDENNARLNPPKTTELLQQEAQQLRDELTESNIEFGETGAIYQINVLARDNINIANIKAEGLG